MVNATRQTQSTDEEILSRVRRIETRVTQLMVGLGIGTQAQKPAFNYTAGQVDVPSMHSSLQEILDSIPLGWQGPVKVCIKNKQLASLEVL